MSPWSAIGLAVLASCESAPQPRADLPAAQRPARVGRGHPQVEVAVDLQLAIAQGRLSDARDLANRLATPDSNETPGWQAYLADVRRTAHQVERAGDVAAAGMALGQLGRACGACHEATGGTAVIAAGIPPESSASLTDQMQRHQWAAATLWQGVIGPAATAWRDAAVVMATTPLDVADAVHERPNVETFELAERLHEQAAHAVVVTDADARAALYGDMMKTCASCHRILRPAPVEH